jgi:hypothetical protein
MDFDLILTYELLKACREQRLDHYLSNLGKGKQQIAVYHLELLLDGNYIKGVHIHEPIGGLAAELICPRLTHQGHELLGELEKPDRISLLKQKALELNRTLTLEFVKALLSALATKLIAEGV